MDVPPIPAFRFFRAKFQQAPCGSGLSGKIIDLYYYPASSSSPLRLHSLGFAGFVGDNGAASRSKVLIGLIFSR